MQDVVRPGHRYVPAGIAFEVGDHERKPFEVGSGLPNNRPQRRFAVRIPECSAYRVPRVEQGPRVIGGKEA